MSVASSDSGSGSGSSGAARSALLGVGQSPLPTDEPSESVLRSVLTSALVDCLPAALIAPLLSIVVGYITAGEWTANPYRSGQVSVLMLIFGVGCSCDAVQRICLPVTKLPIHLRVGQNSMRRVKSCRFVRAVIRIRIRIRIER